MTIFKEFAKLSQKDYKLHPFSSKEGNFHNRNFYSNSTYKPKDKLADEFNFLFFGDTM
jgi:hypothetical protein